MFLEQFQNYRIIVKILQGVPLYPISSIPHYKEPIMMPSYNFRPDFFFFFLDFLSFLLCPFPVPGSYLGHHITCSYHVSLGFSSLLQFLRILLFLMTMTILRIVVRYFAESPSTGICLLFFSSGDWGNVLWKEDHRGEVPFSSYPSKGTCYHDFSLLMLTWTAWLNIGLLMLPIAESFFFFWKCLCAAHTWRVGHCVLLP